jgi:hypothetical protein
MLLPGREPDRLLRDHAPQLAEEGEVDTAPRLLARAVGSEPRAFDLASADTLYGIARSDFPVRLPPLNHPLTILPAGVPDGSELH